MSIYYLDANPQVKYFLDEPGSTWVRQIVDETDAEGTLAHRFLTAEISLVEVAAAIATIQRVGRIRRGLRDRAFDRHLKTIASRYELIPIASVSLYRAASLTQHYPLKGYDAVH